MAEEAAAHKIELKRDEDYTSLYANNVRFESSVWDLKLIFGELDQSEGKEVIEQHTAITLPWAQAKLLMHFLNVQIAAHELTFGKIPIPPSVVPQELSVTPELQSNESAAAVVELANKLRSEFIKIL
jgi:hypothetical protein